MTVVSTMIKIAKENWIFIAIAIVVIIIMNVAFSSEKYYDYELAGCSTCSAGDAGVLLDTESSEMYNMPDDYYSNPMEIADTIAEVAHNPDEFAAVVEDREDESDVVFVPEEKVIDPTDYAEQSDKQIVADFYGDEELDYDEQERVRAIRFMPLDFDTTDGAYTIL
ncbi:hypothetical protein PBCVNEJV1_854R [Paramecium bursaria Chlorella virus NE-JV-1]|nr:hypothetical protein PBCVNEJV1_854R [Paramecium bursaria Chlorella virus NE-JV-1]